MVRLLTGDNQFAIDDRVRTLRRDFVNTEGEYGLSVLDGSDVTPARVKEAIHQLPFLVNRSLVIIKSVFASKDIVDMLADELNEIPSDIDVVLVDTKADKRTRLYKELEKNKSIESLQNPSEQALIRWVVEYTESLGGSMNDTDARYLVERIGTDQLLLKQEIDKLVAYNKNVTQHSINLLTEPKLTDSVFDLLDATFQQKKDLAWQVYAHLVEARIDAAEILGLMAWQLNILLVVASARQKPKEEIASKARIHPFVVSRAQRILASLSLGDIKKHIRTALEIDHGVKTGRYHPDDAVKVLISELLAE